MVVWLEYACGVHKVVVGIVQALALVALVVLVNVLVLVIVLVVLGVVGGLSVSVIEVAIGIGDVVVGTASVALLIKILFVRLVAIVGLFALLP